MKKFEMVLVIIFVVILFIVASAYSREAKTQEQINNGLQIEYEKVTTENEHLRYKVEVLEEKNLETERKYLETEEKLERVLKLTSNSVEQIKRVAMSETMGANLFDATGVIQSIKDRSESWDMTAAEVVNQPYQYANPYQGQINETVDLAFELVYMDGYRTFDEVTTHFHADYVNPYWAESKAFRGKVSRHLYYGPKEAI